MDMHFIVVISSGQGLNSDALFSTRTQSLCHSLRAIGVLQEVVPAVNAAIYASGADLSAACVLRVRDGHWSVPARQLLAVA